MINTRDYILCELFKKPDGLLIADICKDVPVSPPEVKEIVQKFCNPVSVEIIDEEGTSRVRKLWRLKVERDSTFNHQFPDVAAFARKDFDVISRNVEKIFKKSECKFTSIIIFIKSF